MRKLVLLGAAAGIGWLVNRSRRPSHPLDLAHVDPDRPQEPIERIEAAADVPGGVRP
jgi:hypothetical protein